MQSDELLRATADGAGAAAPEWGVPQYPIGSVDRALKLLLLLGEQPQIRLTDAAKHLGVASSTAHRLLAMLQYRGFVRQDPVSKAYHPGPAADERGVFGVQPHRYRECGKTGPASPQ